MIKGLKSLYHLLRKNLQIKIAISTTILVGLATVISTYSTITHVESQITRNIKQKLSETSKKFSDSFSDIKKEHPISELKRIFSSMQAYPHSGVHVHMYDTTGTIFMSPDSFEIGTKAKLERDYPSDSALVIFIENSDEEGTIYAQRPILNMPKCYNCHNSKSPVLGMIEVSASMAGFEAQSALVRNYMLGSALVSFLVMSFCLVFLLKILVSRSILKLTHSMKRVENGDMNVFLESRRTDEIGLLWNSFEAMVKKLRKNIHQAEKQHQNELQHADRLATIGEIASGIAHEIRNPLAGISGAVHVLYNEMVQNNPDKEVLGEIQNEINRLDYSLEGFLSYARPAEPHPQLKDIHKIIESSLVLCMQSGQLSEIILIRDYNLEKGNIKVDPTLIKQVFVNIILNALQAMKNVGSLTITTCKSDNSGCVDIIFTDSGPGIPNGDIEKIYQPFFSSKSNGTGLGLAIANRIIDQHNGGISVCNKKDKGACFIITLPI